MGLLALVALEIFCFLIVTIGNYLVYGHIWEGSRVRYDPYALFLNVEGVRLTTHNFTVGPDGKPRKIVWLLGGSTLRGSTEHDDRTIPSYLAAILNRPGSSVECTVVNFGENSFNSLMEAKYLRSCSWNNPSPPT